MNVKLISLTNAIIEGKQLTPEELIVFTARVSNPSNQMNFETSDKLVSYLVKNKHWSPFEMVDMTVEITTSRGIAQQILRHRSFSFQEFSQRYSKVNNIEPVNLRYKGETNRQSSSDNLSLEDSEYFNQKLNDIFELSQNVYNEMIEKNVAKECARFILPISTETTLYMKGSVRSWIHYLQIRCDSHTQLEHRHIAQSILEIFKNNFPNISKAIEI